MLKRKSGISVARSLSVKSTGTQILSQVAIWGRGGTDLDMFVCCPLHCTVVCASWNLALYGVASRLRCSLVEIHHNILFQYTTQREQCCTCLMLPILQTWNVFSKVSVVCQAIWPHPLHHHHMNVCYTVLCVHYHACLCAIPSLPPL